MNVVSYMRISKHLILSLCLILCSCFTHPKQSQSPLCSDSDVPVPYPCRLDKDIAKKIFNTSGRKNHCDNSSYCSVEEDSFVYVVRSISEDAFSCCIEKWNSKAEVAEIDSLNFVLVDYDYYYNAEIDGFPIWENAWIDVNNSGACYNIKEGILF